MRPHINNRPQELFVTPQQQGLLEQHQSGLKSRGFWVERSDEKWFLCGVPQLKDTVFGVSDLEEMMAKLDLSNPDADIPYCEKLRSIYASKSCRSAVMIGDPIGPSEMRKIVDQMTCMSHPWNCPHGRPTVRVLARCY